MAADIFEDFETPSKKFLATSQKIKLKNQGILYKLSSSII